MLLLLFGIMLVLLILGFPMLCGMLAGPVTALSFIMPEFDLSNICQYLITGINSFVLLAVPMFMLAGNIMGSGQMANRLTNFVKTLLGHLPGGLAITASGTCTIFGAISGSAPATNVAIGVPMYPMLKDAGYSDSHASALLATNANIALLIPPSVVMVIYCVCTNNSVGDLFIAGIIPGLIMFFAFSVYEFVYSKAKHMPLMPKASFKEILYAFRQALLPLGFPVIVLGGIYSGIFSPTEAAAVSCAYAFVVEVFIFKSIKIKDMMKIGLKTARVVATTYILMASGKVISWVVSYSGIAAQISRAMLGENPTANSVLIAISLVFIVSCCFVDSIPIILITMPIFYTASQTAGVDPIHLGIIVTFWSAIGCITPPFGCNLFVSISIFKQKFTTIVKGIWPYIIISLVIGFTLVFIPELSLFLI